MRKKILTMLRYIRTSKRLVSSLAYEAQLEVPNIPMDMSLASASMKVEDLIKSSPSTKFVNSISTTHFTSIIDNDLVVKRQLYKVYDTRNFHLLLKLILSFTNTKKWKNVLSQDELIFFIDKLVSHQISLLKQHSYSKMLAKQTMGSEYNGYDSKLQLMRQSDEQLGEAQKFIKGIRTIYGNLLLNGKKSIYAKELRPQMQFDDCDYKMTVGDYENLTKLEYYNHKLDLVNKWFQRLQANKVKMTNSLWDIKLKMNGADPRLWENISYQFYNKKRRIKRSIFQGQMYSQILNEYMEQGGRFDDQLSNIIYALGYDGKIEEIYTIIKTKYGIDNDKQISQTSEKLDMKTVNAIVVALSYNNRFSEAMGLVNVFQKYFDLDFNTKVDGFWDNLFKWSDITTRYSRESVLRYFINNFNPTVTSFTYKELLNDPEFDYDRYTTFLNDLTSTRRKLITQVWDLYQTTNGRFVTSPYLVYTNLLKQLRDEDKMYEMLTVLYKHYKETQVTSKSFNKSNLNNINDSVVRLYSRNLRNLINLKFQNNEIDYIPVIIKEWSLNDDMAMYFTKHYNAKLPIYEKYHEIKKGDEMLKNNQDDQDKMLDLF